MSDDATNPPPLLPAAFCSVFVCSAELGMELGVRLVSICSDLRSLLDLIEKCPQRGLVLDRGDDCVKGPNEGDYREEDEKSLPSARR